MTEKPPRCDQSDDRPTRLTRLRQSRAVSDVVGFVLVFSLITAIVGLVYATGMTGLTHARDMERVENAERAFEVLGDNFADIHRQNAPSRATEFKLADAELRHGTETQITVNVTNVGPPHPVQAADVSPIVYEAADATLAYESGAIIRTDGTEGGVMIHPPQQRFAATGGARRATVPLLATHAQGTRAIAGSETILVRAEHTESEVLTDLPPKAADAAGVSEYDVRYTVETTPIRAPVWDRYLEAQLTWETDACDTSGDTVTCTFTVDELRVSTTHANVAFS